MNTTFSLTFTPVLPIPQDVVDNYTSKGLTVLQGENGEYTVSGPTLYGGLVLTICLSSIFHYLIDKELGIDDDLFSAAGGMLCVRQTYLKAVKALEQQNKQHE